jgi:hypothetical protein
MQYERRRTVRRAASAQAQSRRHATVAVGNSSCPDGRGPKLRPYDTSDRQVRPVTPGATATIYVCGNTPHDATHLGHAATYVAFDLVYISLPPPRLKGIPEPLCLIEVRRRHSPDCSHQADPVCGMLPPDDVAHTPHGAELPTRSAVTNARERSLKTRFASLPLQEVSSTHESARVSSRGRSKLLWLVDVNRPRDVRRLHYEE